MPPPPIPAACFEFQAASSFEIDRLLASALDDGSATEIIDIRAPGLYDGPANDEATLAPEDDEDIDLGTLLDLPTLAGDDTLLDAEVPPGPSTRARTAA